MLVAAVVVVVNRVVFDACDYQEKPPSSPCKAHGCNMRCFAVPCCVYYLLNEHSTLFIRCSPPGAAVETTAILEEVVRHWSGRLPSVDLNQIHNSALVGLALSDTRANAEVAANLLGTDVNSCFPTVLSAEERESLKNEAPRHLSLGPEELVAAATG
jgi:hypothetical protein